MLSGWGRLGASGARRTENEEGHSTNRETSANPAPLSLAFVHLGPATCPEKGPASHTYPLS